MEAQVCIWHLIVESSLHMELKDPNKWDYTPCQESKHMTVPGAKRRQEQLPGEGQCSCSSVSSWGLSHPREFDSGSLL